MVRDPKGATSPLDSLILEAYRHLEDLRYSSSALSHYRATWRAVQLFATSRRCRIFSDGLAERFLASRGIPLAQGQESRNVRHVRMALRVLSEFQRDGCFQRRRNIAVSVVLLPSMVSGLEAYNTYCAQHAGALPRTMRVRVRLLTTFLHFVAARGRRTLRTIDGADISAFVRARAHLASKTVAVEVATVRSFLRVGCVIGLFPSDLSDLVPKVRVRPDARIPAVWREGDVDAILRSVDRASPIGKRDFAIILLACRLGMRAGDIRNLTLDNLCWDRAHIALAQGKTANSLELPLTDEVAEALIDYVRNGRPKTTRREVFLRIHAPFEPLGRDNNLYDILTRYRRLAGVRLDPCSRRGLHSLRHNIASRLLASGVAIETIAGILGQASLDTTRIYTKVDINALREAALEVDGGWK